MKPYPNETCSMFIFGDPNAKKNSVESQKLLFPTFNNGRAQCVPPPLPTQAIGKFSTPTHANNKLTFSVDW